MPIMRLRPTKGRKGRPNRRPGEMLLGRPGALSRGSPPCNPSRSIAKRALAAQPRTAAHVGQGDSILENPLATRSF